MNLFVVRHGQTDKNILGCIQGQTESNLTIEGIEEAKKLYDVIKEKNIDIVFSSPLSRAVKTAEFITNGTFDINIDSRLNERDYGIYEGKKRTDFDFISYWNYEKNLAIEDGETLKEAFDRISNFIEEIKEKYVDKNVLIVTHNGVSRIIYYKINGIPEDNNFDNLYIPNLSIFEYRI